MGLEDRDLADAQQPATPTIDAPTPGGSSPAPALAPAPQAPTGFGGPMPGENTRPAPHTGLASPMPGRIPEGALDQFSPSTQAMLQTMSANPAIAWTDAQRDSLERSLRVQDASLDSGPRLNQIMNSVMENTDPSIIELGEKKFNRQVAMTTQEMFEERTFQKMIGYVDDDEAFSASANELWGDTWGSVFSAGQVLTNAENQKTYFTEHWLGNSGTYDKIENEVTEYLRAEWSDRFNEDFDAAQSGSWGLMPSTPEGTTPSDATREARGALREVTGKGGAWAVEGNNLAMQLTDDEGSWNVLVRLKPGTTIGSSADAVEAYALARADAMHAIDPTSDDVAGPQAALGKFWEGLDNVLLSIQKWGTSGTVPSVNEQVAAIDHAMFQGRRNPPVDGEDQEYRSVLENEQGMHIEKANRESVIAAIARNTPKDENTPMNQVVAAGMAAFDEIPDSAVAQMNAESIDRMVEAAQAKEAQSSYVSQFLQEEVFPPVLGALEAWESALQFAGVTVLHFTTSDELVDLARRVADEGLSALADPENLKLVPTIDYQQVMDDFDDIRNVGLPTFVDGYMESMEGVTVADEYGLEPGTAAWQATNLAGSLLVDPITWLTLGGNASWKALSQSMTTLSGARNYVNRPHVVSALSQMVKKDNTNLIAIFATEGMDSASISRLSKIVGTNYTDDAARAAAIIEGQEILVGALQGTWLPSGPARVATRKTTLGLGQFFANLGNKGYTGQKFYKLAQDVLTRAPRQRFAAIGEREFLSDVSTRLTIMYGDDAPTFAAKMDEAIGVYDAVRVGDEAIGVIQGQIQATRQRLTDLAAGVTDDVKFLPTLRGNVKQMDDSIKALDDQIAKREAVGDTATAAQLREARDRAVASRNDSQAYLDELTPQYNEVNAAIRNEQKVLDRYLHTQELLGTGERGRGVLERYTHSLMDEWADTINTAFVEKGWATADDLPIPLVPNQTNPWFPDLPLRDWSRVTGENTSRTYRTAQAGNLEAFAENAIDLRAIGMGAIAGSTRLPASPYELLAFSHTRPSVWNKLHFSTMGRGFQELMNGVQTVWSANILLNPRTSIRSSLDEVIRLYEDNGLNADSLKAAYRSFPKTENVGGAVGPEARAWAREQLDNFMPSSQQTWEMVDPSKRGMWVHAERWVNGTLMNDSQLKAYARAVTGSGGDDAVARQLWEEWWNETGAKLSRRNTYAAVSGRAGEPITAGNSFDIIGNALDTWLAGTTDDAVRAEAKDAMLTAAANNGLVNKQAAFWRQLGDVPGALDTQTGGPIGRGVEGGFNVFYGSPQVRRGGVFYDHYYGFAHDTLTARHGGKASEGGKILDADWLIANGHASTLTDANNLIAAGTRNEAIRQIVAESGYVLAADLKNAAMRWAGTQADNMMYTFGAGSVLGKKMSRVYPFGRAQVDYAQWWWKKVTQPTQFGLPGARTARFAPSSPAGVPNPLGVITNNVNVRLVDRMAHLLSVGEPQEPGEFEKSPGLSAAGMIENLTFLPTTLDHQTVMEIPSFGPLPGWMVNLPLEGVVPGWENIRQGLLETNPSLMQFTEPYENWADAVTGLWDSVVPKSGLSVWNLGRASGNALLLAAAYATLGINPEDPTTPEVERRINMQVNSMIWEQETPFWRDRASAGLAEWLTKNGSSQLPDLNNEEWVGLQDIATIASLQNNLLDTVGKIGGVAVQGGSDFQYTDALTPVADYVETWYDEGWLSEGKRDSILIGLGLIDSEKATPKDRLVFADDVLDALFTLIPSEERTKFIAENPGAAINFVSWYNVVPSLVPEYARAGVSGNRIIATGEEGRELRRRGREDGWITAKDPNQHHYEAHMSVHRSYRDRITDIYEEVINGFVGADLKEMVDLDPDKAITFSKETKAFMALTGPIPADWWADHGEWLDGVEGFNPPEAAVAAWTAGQSYSMSVGEFRGMFKTAKKRYAYQYTTDTLHETALNRLGDHDERPTKLAVALRSLEGYEDVSLDATKPLSYYGADLVDDLAEAVRVAEREFGWTDPREWETNEFSVEVEDGVYETYNLDEFRSRFQTAVALSALAPDDQMNFTQQDYESSQWARWFGDINFEPPEPPPLTDVETAHTTTPDYVTVTDGDTVKIMGEDGPVFLRLLGINAPEKNTPGGGASALALMDLIDDADEVSFAIWQPEKYGRTQTFFTRDEDGAVTYRDRTFVWLYVDGVPIYDSTVFSATNVRGVGVGGESVPDYQKMYRDGLYQQPAGGS